MNGALFARFFLLTMYYYVHSLQNIRTARRTSVGVTSSPEVPFHGPRVMTLHVKGGYSSDGKQEGKVIFAIASLFFIRSLFVPVDLKTATVCPSGLNAERSLEKFQAYDPDYHCLPAGELLKQFFTSRWVFPGDPDFDENWLKIELRGVRKAGTPKILN